MSDSPFWHYNTVLDAVGLVRRHADNERVATPGYLTNYFGVKIDPVFFPDILSSQAGTVEGDTVPANWHADLAEFAGALRAVDLSSPEGFTMIELGCGWGCWMNITGACARRTGRPVHLIGVEGDEHHATWARQSMATNGFSESEYTIHRGIAAATSGVALFPKADDPGGTWGSAPIFHASDEQLVTALRANSHDVLQMLPLDMIAEGHDRIDLLHIDIQGGEADLVAGCLRELSERVAYLVIGTHSREIEGRLFETLSGKGWKLEIERPLILNMATQPPAPLVDGVQGWRNLALLPDQGD